MTDWTWEEDGMITIQFVGDDDEIVVGRTRRLSLVPTSQLAPSCKSRADEENITRCDNGICSATSITYQHLKRNAHSWSDFLGILSKNPILSLTVSNPANAHDRSLGVFRAVETIIVGGMNGGKVVSPENVSSKLSDWIDGLSARLGPLHIHEDVRLAYKRILPAINSMSEAFCDVEAVEEMEHGHTHGYVTHGRVGSLEVCYKAVDNGLLRYPDFAKPSIVGYGIAINGTQSFKCGRKGFDRSLSLFEVTAELNVAIFDVFYGFTLKRAMKAISSKQTSSIIDILAAQRMVRGK